MNKKKIRGSIPFDEFTEMYFKKDPAFAKSFLKYEFKEFLKSGDPRYFLDTLKIYAKAKGFSNLQKETGLSRKALYDALSKDGNPKLSSFLSILKALNLKMEIREVRK